MSKFLLLILFLSLSLIGCQKQGDDTKQALFRANGAWTHQVDLPNTNQCSDLIYHSDQILGFEKFTSNSYVIDLRVGKQNSMWTNPSLQKQVEELNSTHGNLKADVSISGQSANVVLYRSDGNIIKSSYTYEKATDTLILKNIDCVKCPTYNIKGDLLYKILKEKGSIRGKFCIGNY